MKINRHAKIVELVNKYHIETQEELAEKCSISRQAVAKWEKGETVPDVERCQKLAELYGVTIDSLVNYSNKIGTTTLAPGPKGKHIFGTTKINDRGQVVIPKKARELFGINNGDSLVVLGDEAEHPCNRKRIGDFACYIVFVNSICAR